MKIKTTLLACTLLSALGCGKSPLLNHAQANGGGGNPGAPTPHLTDERGQCPLQFTGAGLCASITWDKPPVSDAAATLVLRYWNKDSGTFNGPYINPSHAVGVKLWMPDMGHGSSPVAVAQAVDQAGVAVPGVFKATNIYFIMPGAWEVHVQLKDGTTVVEEAVATVSI